MLYKEFEDCKICGIKAKANHAFASHLKQKHNLTLKEYIEKYFEIPICKYCNKEHVEVYGYPLQRFKKYNRFWKLTCTNKACISKYITEIQKEYYKDNEAARELHRKQRIEYLKQKTGKTAWERRAAGEMSYLEEWFFDNVIVKYDLTEKYDVINELSVYPYFIDFAFKNIKVAVELDGRCHFVHGETRNGHDRKKDEHLIKHGWKVFRIGYTENNEKTIQEFLIYISKIDAGEKQLPNRMFKYTEYRNLNKPKRTREEWFEEQNKKLIELNQPLVELVKNSNIDFSKWGWKTQVGLLINKDSRKIVKWMQKYMPEFYNSYCK